MRRIWQLGFMGLISGILSFFVWDKGYVLSDSDLLILYAPGIIFGAVLGVFFFISALERKLSSIFFCIAWILASWGSFYLAVLVTVQLFIKLNNLDVSSASIFKLNQAIPFFVGGVVGGCCVALAFSLFINRGLFFSIFAIALIGGILGLTAVYLPFGDANIHAMFIIWQTGVAAAFGYISNLQSKHNTYETLGS